MKAWNVLYFDLVKLKKNDMIWGLLELSLPVRRAERCVPDAVYSEEDLNLVLEEIKDEELIVSQNFSAVVAEACHQKQRIYLSWVYDSPQVSLFMKEALYDTNRIFVFDKRQLTRMKETGLPYVFYQPLAANVTRLSGLVIEDEEIEKYRTDVLFVGGLYQDARRTSYLNALPEKMKIELEELFAGKIGRWGLMRREFKPLSEDTRETMFKSLNQSHLEEYRFDSEYLLQTLILSREVSQRERIEILSLLSRQCEVRCYTTGTPDERLLRVHFLPPIEGEEEVFKAYYSAKINLNHTLTSIETGIPLRVFDILGVGGFVLSNDQEEFHELFEVDKELVTFSDFDEMLGKADYYLRHEELRVRIGVAGYEKVRACYTYPIAMKKMLEEVEKTV